MPFRCKCGRTFEKVETFGSHTSGCPTFHHRRVSSADIRTLRKEQEPRNLSVQTSPDFFANNESKTFSFLSPTYSFRGFVNTPMEQSSARSAPIVDTERFSFMMPTALSIQNTFEGVQRKRSMSYSTTNTATAAYK